MLSTNMGETIATIEVAIVLIKHGLLMSFFTLIGAGLLRHLSFGWQQCVGAVVGFLSDLTTNSTWCLPRSCITGRSLETVMVAGSVHCGLVRSDQRGNYVQPARLYSMLRNADRTTILLCVCPSGQKKVRKPFAGVDVISLWVGGELALVCNSSGWRMVGEETHGG